MNNNFIHENDLSLLNEEFKITSPEELPDTVKFIEKSDGISKILTQYDLKPPKGEDRDYIYCSHCKGRHHWKGYLIELSSGKLATLGNDCGRDQFGLDFNIYENTFTAQNNRRTALLRILQIQDVLPQVISELEDELSSQNMQIYNKYIADFRCKFGKLGQGIASSLDESKTLMASYSVRDIAAEETRAQRALPHLFQKAEHASPERAMAINEEIKAWMAKQPHMTKFESKPIGHCLGSDVFTSSKTPENILIEALKKLEEIQNGLNQQDSSEWSSLELSNLLKGVKSIIDEIDDAKECFIKLNDFGSTSNLQTICRWSKEDQRYSVSVEMKDGVLFNPKSKVQIVLSEDFSVPSFKQNSILREAHILSPNA